MLSVLGGYRVSIVQNTCAAFFLLTRALNDFFLLTQALLIHVGEEHSVTAGFIDNSLGNPLFMRK